MHMHWRFQVFGITIDLTDQGVQNVDDVVALCFQYLHCPLLYY
jgi:secreted Zn-dependent insulinase-like peptidase